MDTGCRTRGAIGMQNAALPPTPFLILPNENAGVGGKHGNQFQFTKSFASNFITIFVNGGTSQHSQTFSSWFNTNWNGKEIGCESETPR